MPIDPNASVRISAFNWVPPFAQGQVRDLRPRWALEEAGISYAVRKLDATAARPVEYYTDNRSARSRATMMKPSRCSKAARSFCTSRAIVKRSCPAIRPHGLALRRG